ncbi:FHA domain-containing protein, partial [Staphylococcus capitis]|uniref:FHA domain-containing protein n=1 Tax=Staphylococcus capitis TaxID=29388 RepID=UPI0031BAA83E
RWLVRDLKSRNGIEIDGVRILDDAMLQHKAELVLGKTRLVYLNAAEKRGKTTEPLKAKPELTKRQHQVLEELCRPVINGGRFIAPASDAEIGDRLCTGQANIRNFLGELYRKFDIEEGRGRRNRLAEEAIDRGSVNMNDLRD